MADIFISYASKDKPTVDYLCADLMRRDIDYWIDAVGLLPGTPSWERAIRQAIKEATTVIWVVSPASYESNYVRDEITLARMEKRQIIPVWIDGEVWEQCVPLGTFAYHHADMRGKARYPAGLKRLLEALEGHHPELVVKVEEPTPVPKGVEPRNPYKGLHAFTEKDAGDFFGRSTLVATLTHTLSERLQPERPRFLAVLGVSGAGKSSVVMAGLIPKLKQGGIPHSQDWTYLPRIAPGKRPVQALADALHTKLPNHALSTIETDLKAGGRYLSRLVDKLEGKHVFLYVDQFEEVFTLTQDADERQQFIDLLTTASTDSDGKLITVVSMRADFYGHPMHYPQLGTLITSNQVAVLPMTITELYEAIHKPALLPDVGLRFDDGLMGEIVFELRDQQVALQGALPFLEFTLDRLFEAREGNQLKRHAYERMGGVAGAIGNHAEHVFTTLSAEIQATFGQVFLPLTNVDPTNGEATRRRAKYDEVIRGDDARQKLVNRLVDGRLLTTGRTEEGAIYVEVAHEALFRSWERLTKWVGEAHEDLKLVNQVHTDAAEWDKAGRPDALLWKQARLKLVYAMQKRMNPDWEEWEEAFIEPEQKRLYRELARLETTHERRRTIGDYLAEIGDTRFGVGVKDGVPEIAWVPVQGSDGKKVQLWDYKDKSGTARIGKFAVPDFYLSTYLVTHAQYQAFVDADDGYNNPIWWQGFPEQLEPLKMASIALANSPRNKVSWYQSVAFTRWLDARLRQAQLLPDKHLQVRLPTEWEWQWAARNGREARVFPWGDWRAGVANSREAGLGRPTAVGMYPHGAAACKALDMTGNLREWCANNFDDQNVNYDISIKVLRGGSFSDLQDLARSSYRNYIDPNYGNHNFGFRLVVAPSFATLTSGTLNSAL